MIKDIIQTVAYSPFTWIAVLFVLVLFALNNVRLGKPDPRRPTNTPWLNGLIYFAAAFSPVLLLLFLTVLAMLALVGWQILGSDTIAKDPDNLRWYVLSFVGLLTALGGVIGTPLALIRIWTTERQTATQEEALFNEKINAASEALAARRQVTRVVGHGRAQRVLTEWQDDILSRAAAIDRLEGLVHERPAAADRIASLLSVYVVELSQEQANRPEPAPNGATPDKLHDWASRLTRKRLDMEKAAQTLGRLQQIADVQFQGRHIDLRHANLQACDLRGLDFKNARLDDAHMEGASLTSINLEEASLGRAHLEGADIVAAHMEGAFLAQAHLERANLSQAHLGAAYMAGVHLEGADLGGAHMEDTYLWGAHMDGANMAETHLEGANLWRANLEGAYLWPVHMDDGTSLTNTTLGSASLMRIDWSELTISQDQVDSVFGDASVTLPDTVVRPAHWPNTKLSLSGFGRELKKWRADPASYTPPQDRA